VWVIKQESRGVVIKGENLPVRQSPRWFRPSFPPGFSAEERDDMEEDNPDALSDDPDDLSYEELLRLEERIGDVNTGATADDLMRLPVWTYPHKLRVEMMEEEEKAALETLCLVCRMDFEGGEEVRQLPCKHFYHRGCIDIWLQQ